MKKVLVTGASRGIGKCIAGLFAQNGYEVTGPGRDELDLTRPESVEAFVAAHRDDGFDVIINNAGWNDINLLADVTDEELERMMSTNLVSPIRLLRGLTGGMKAKNYGRIVNIGSVWAVVSKPGRGIYSATKNGLHGITNTLALELGPHNVLVNTVCPGFVETEMTRKNNTPEQIAALTKDLPLRRLAQPAEVAELVYFLGSEKNTYLTGQKITIDGGYTIQ